jgi:ankyrin repeat protein
MPYLLLFLTLVTHLSAQVSDGRDMQVSTVSFIGNKQSETIPLISGRGLIFTKSVSINGKAAGVFIIDTGSNVSIIDQEKLLEFGLNETFQGLNEVSDLRKFRFFKVKELQIGRMKIKNHFIYSGKVTANYTKFSEPIIGILGGDILGKLPFKLDLHNFTLSFYQRAAFKPQGQSSPLAIQNKLLNLGFFSEANPYAGVPLVKVRINDTLHEQLMIDTAEESEVILRSDKAVRNRQLAGSFKLPLVLRKAGSSLLQFNALITKVELAGQSFHLDKLFSYVLFPRQGYIAEESQVGTKVFNNCILSCDYQQGKVWLEKATSPAVYRKRIDFAGHTPLARAVRNGNEKRVSQLLDKEDELNFKGLKQETLLMLATEGKNSTVMELLIKKFPLLVNTYNHAGVTALMRAAAANEVLMVDSLLKNKADIERPDIDGMTSLHYAILGGSLVMMDKLIRQKANINLPMKNGMRPLSLAAGEGNKQLFTALLEAGAILAYLDKGGRSLLHLAAYGNRADIIQIILNSKKSPNIDAPASDGMTPLMVAIKHQRMASVNTLLKKGASVKVMNSKDFTTALDLAYKSKNDTLIELIQTAWDN